MNRVHVHKCVLIEFQTNTNRTTICICTYVCFDAVRIGRGEKFPRKSEHGPEKPGLLDQRNEFSHTKSNWLTGRLLLKERKRIYDRCLFYLMRFAYRINFASHRSRLNKLTQRKITKNGFGRMYNVNEKKPFVIIDTRPCIQMKLLYGIPRCQWPLIGHSIVREYECIQNPI